MSLILVIAGAAWADDRIDVAVTVDGATQVVGFQGNQTTRLLLNSDPRHRYWLELSLDSEASTLNARTLEETTRWNGTVVTRPRSALDPFPLDADTPLTLPTSWEGSDIQLDIQRQAAEGWAGAAVYSTELTALTNEEALASAISELVAREGWHEDITALSGDLEAAVASGDASLLESLWQRLEGLALGYGAQSRVWVTTPAQGAWVYYQLYYERAKGHAPHQLGGPTNDGAIGSLPIGRYYIWSERDAGPTSDRNRLILIEDINENISLRESDQPR